MAYKAVSIISDNENIVFNCTKRKDSILLTLSFLDYNDVEKDMMIFDEMEIIGIYTDLLDYEERGHISHRLNKLPITKECYLELFDVLKIGKEEKFF